MQKKQTVHRGSADGIEKLIGVLQNWKVLLVAMLVGAALGQLVSMLFPPPYRARAVMVMDQNLEAVFPTESDREIFYFLERETQKLEAIAWSDEVLEPVAEQVKGYTLQQLRSGSLLLSQPYDGGWNMYGVSSDAETARTLANAWADSFTDAVRKGVENARLLQQAQEELGAIPAADLAQSARAKELNQLITRYQSSSMGIHPEIEVYRSEQKNIKVAPAVIPGAYVFVGAILGLVVSVLALAVWRKDDVH